MQLFFCRKHQIAATNEVEEGRIRANLIYVFKIRHRYIDFPMYQLAFNSVWIWLEAIAINCCAKEFILHLNKRHRYHSGLRLPGAYCAFACKINSLFITHVHSFCCVFFCRLKCLFQLHHHQQRR